MVRALSFGLVLLVAAGLAYSAPAAPAPAGAVDLSGKSATESTLKGLAPAAEADLTKYVPDDAFLVGRLRMRQLVESDFWKKLRGPADGPVAKALQDFPLNVNLEKDVTEVMIVLSIEATEDGPGEPMFGAIMQLTSTPDPATFVKNGKAEKILLPGLTAAAYRVSASQFYAFATPQRVIVASSPDQLSMMLAIAAGKEPQKDRSLVKLLDQPGEFVMAVRLPAALVDMMKQKQAEMDEMGMMGGGPQALLMGIPITFAMTMMTEFKSMVLSFDLSRKADAVRAVVTTSTENGAAFIGSGLALMEPAFTKAVTKMDAIAEAAKNGQPPAGMMPPEGPGAAPGAPPAKAPAPAAAPAEPLYTSVFQGKEARITVTRPMVDKIANLFLMFVTMREAHMGGGMVMPAGPDFNDDVPMPPMPPMMPMPAPMPAPMAP